MIDAATSAMKANPLMKATIKIYDLLVSNGGSFAKRMAMTIVFCKYSHIVYCGDGERENFLQKKLTKLNLNKMLHLQKGVIFSIQSKH